MRLQDVRNAVQGLEGIWGGPFNATFNQSFALYERQINAGGGGGSSGLRLYCVLPGGKWSKTVPGCASIASGIAAGPLPFGDEGHLRSTGDIADLFKTSVWKGNTAPRNRGAALDMASVFGGDAAGSARRSWRGPSRRPCPGP